MEPNKTLLESLESNSSNDSLLVQGVSPTPKRREIGVNWKERSCVSLTERSQEVIKLGYLKKRAIFGGRGKYVSPKLI